MTLTPIFFVVTVVSSSVLLHTLLLGDDEELPMARQRLESNFEFLVRLKEIWPSVDVMVDTPYYSIYSMTNKLQMKRLITFQNACLRTAQLGTHRFDKWMLKFLLQHALSLDEHDGSHISTTSSGRPTSIEDERLLQRSRVTGNILGTLPQTT